MDGGLEGAFAVVLFILLVMFIAGMAAAIASVVLVIKKKKPVIAIILSVISFPLIAVPLFFTVGLFLAVPLLLVFIAIVTVLSVRLIKADSGERN
ncbi:MAG: hypothetical protein MJ079_05030 [Ruminococcus sp.]|nr:hypothetical protein [Ruminococcus sp.]